MLTFTVIRFHATANTELCCALKSIGREDESLYDKVALICLSIRSQLQMAKEITLKKFNQLCSRIFMSRQCNEIAYQRWWKNGCIKCNIAI